MIATLIGEFWPYVVAGAAALAAVLGFYTKGRSDQKQKAAAKKAKDDEETHERIDDVKPAGDHNDVVKRLRKLSE